jgi:biotin operon repressor
MVGLSDIDSNKYHAIAKFKNSIVQGVNTAAHVKNISLAHRKINEYNETEVVKIIHPQKRLSDDEMVQIIAEYNNGMSTYRLAEKFGCNRQAISHNLKKHGVSVTNSSAYKKLDIERVISLYENMVDSAQIAKEFDVSPQVIIKCLHDHNIKIRTRWDY